ncbi:MAG: PDZ domain-containing protein [Pyrinomonadaceae bacterium]|nr:PDZ domain-containing protein [Pyrinomonadaceae bacterium]
MKKFPFAIALLLCSFAPLHAQTNASPAPQSPTASAPSASRTEVKPDAAQLRRESFEIVWRTINESHFDPTFGGVDWNKVRADYAPRVAAVKTDNEFYALLRRMIEELKLSHFAIYPPGAMDGASGGSKGGETQKKRGQFGVDVRIVDNQAVITRVVPQSAAARGGLRRGYVITKINDTVVSQMLERIAKSDLTPYYKAAYSVGGVLGSLSGAPGAKVRLTYLDEADRERAAEFTLDPSTDEMSEAFGNFPSVPTQFEARRLENNIGYIRFNIWVASLVPKIRNAVRGMADARGLVIDLRGNPGGLGIMSMGLGGLLTSKPVSLGTMTQRTSHFNFIANPQPNPFAGPVVILVDGLSASTSEIFALGLQEAGRAEVVGEQSAGAALPSVISKLPTGASFQFAIADFKTPKGVRVEGRGVVPDHKVQHTRRALLADRDSQLDAAVERINIRTRADAQK